MGTLEATLAAPRGTHGRDVARKHMLMLGFAIEVVGAFTARGYEVVSFAHAGREGMTICYAPPPTVALLGGTLAGVTPETWAATYRSWVLALPTGLDGAS